MASLTQWHFFDRVYRVWVVFLIGPPEEFKRFLELSTYTETWQDPGSGSCIMLCDENTTNGNRATIVWMKEWNLGCLVHELSHLRDMVLRDKGVDDTEAAAYYTEYWFNEICRARKRLPGGRTATQARKTA